MNVEDAMRRFKDPSEWKLRFDAPGYVARSHATRTPLRFAPATAGALVVLSVIAVLGVAVVNGSDPAPPVAPPMSSPVPTAIEQSVTPDDGWVATSKYQTASNFGHEKSVERGENDSVPWVVMHAANDESGLVIAYVAGGPTCGEHLGVDVVETPTSVTITAVNGALDESAARACQKDPSVEGGAFSLDEPLGTRTLIHDALTAPWMSSDRPIETEPGEERVAPEVPEPQVPAYDGTATCSNLLSDSTRREFAREGWTEVDRSYVDKVWEEGQGEGLFSAFIDNGGLLCGYGTETLVQVLYGYGPITAENESAQRDIQKGNKSTLTRSAGLDVYTTKDPSLLGAVAFGDGVWAFSWDMGGGYSVLADVLKHLPSSE